LPWARGAGVASERLRQGFAAHLQMPSATDGRRARRALHRLRERGTIGDGTFHLVQDDLDRLEMAGLPQ
jgi:hypothetical protein